MGEVGHPWERQRHPKGGKWHRKTDTEMERERESEMRREGKGWRGERREQRRKKRRGSYVGR